MTLLAQHALLDLSAEDRLALIGELWDSLGPAQIPLTEAQRIELDRRLSMTEGEAGPDVPWEELEARLERRSA